VIRIHSTSHFFIAIWLLFVGGGVIDVFSSDALPSAPKNSHLLIAPAAEVVEGEAWLTTTQDGTPTFHLHGKSSIRFDLASLNLNPGVYHIGVIARTGTRWDDESNHTALYRLLLHSTSRTVTTSFGLKQMEAPHFIPVQDQGEPGGWANWYGTLKADAICQLQGNESLLIENLENHGGVLAVWLLPIEPQNSIEINVKVLAQHHAFTLGETPALNVSLRLPSQAPPVDTFIVVQWEDLLTGELIHTNCPISMNPGDEKQLSFSQSFPPGVYRFRVAIDGSIDTAVSDVDTSVHGVFACASAHATHTLPYDWPLGAHVDRDIPPLPGFRWYRYFASWADLNPSPGVYNWVEADRVVKSVRNVGGRLLIAGDGFPIWASKRGKAGMPWSAHATAYPPDDWQTMALYLTNFLQRYAYTKGTIGALELCNEANTPERWLGSTEDMLNMAKVFRAAADEANPPVDVIGLAVSAGDQRAYVKTMVEAGLLDLVDAVSVHFYEEMMSHDAETPINNLMQHVAMMQEPMQQAGVNLPIINSECGIGFVPRTRGALLTQEQINRVAENDPGFDPKRPWLLGDSWRKVSERRAAAVYVNSTVFLMASGVSRSFYFSQENFMLNGAPSLPWVAVSQLGHRLFGVDYHEITALPAHYPDSDQKDGSPVARAFLLGKKGEKQVIIAWGYRRDTKIGRSMHWLQWLDPMPLHVETGELLGQWSDLYGRQVAPVQSVNGNLIFPCGEEPVFIEIEPQGVL